jgi:hypothetical protein
MDDGVCVPAGGSGAIKRLARDPFAAELDAFAHPSQIEPCELHPSMNEAPLQIGRRPDVAQADDERAGGALSANYRIETRLTGRGADVAGPAEACCEGQPGHSQRDGGTLLEEVVRKREVAILANKRRTQESHVGVIAGVVNAKGGLETSRADSHDLSERLEHSLGERLDDLRAVAVRIGRAKRHRGGVRRCGPRGLGVVADLFR